MAKNEELPDYLKELLDNSVEEIRTSIADLMTQPEDAARYMAMTLLLSKKLGLGDLSPLSVAAVITSILCEKLGISEDEIESETKAMRSSMGFGEPIAFQVNEIRPVCPGCGSYYLNRDCEVCRGSGLFDISF